MSGPGAINPPEVVGWGWRGRPERPSPGPGARPRIVLKAVLIPGVLLAFAGAAGFFAFIGSLDRFERSPASRADGIVALTGGSQRIGDAIDLLARGYGRRLLITGVNERTSRDEIARLNPGQRRLFDCCVDLDYRARNTIGNALETRRWMENQHFRSLIVVTSNYHMPRTLLELESALPGTRKVPFAVVNEAVHPDAWWKSPATAKLLASEYVKFLAGWVRTRMERDPEQITAAAYTPVKIAAEPLAN
jgi:uncharacterized SAM-binding protein YcdF (DUF218 family)